MRTRTKTERQKNKKNGKKLPFDSDPQDTNTANYSNSDYSQDELDEQNSQLSMALSINFQPDNISCRRQEKGVLSQFVRNCISAQGLNTNRVLYISGVPGVGKTVLTKQVIKKIRENSTKSKVIFKYFNAMGLQEPKKIYTSMCVQMYKSLKHQRVKFPAITLQSKMQQDKRVKIVIIDQIDFLITKDQSVLYNLFEWANLPETKLCLIIIANTMDFPQRLMPKVASRMGSNRLVFSPYTHFDVRQIIEERLANSNRFSKDAIIYSCKKMSSFTSDVRKILDVLRYCIQQKPEGKIDIDDVVRSWRIVCSDVGGLWQEQLPTFFRNIIDALKQQGGVAFVGRISTRISSKTNFQYSQGQVLEGLRDLQQMGIIKLREKKSNCRFVTEATLLKI